MALRCSISRPVQNVQSRARGAGIPRESSDTSLCLSIIRGFGSDTALESWQDDDVHKLEAHMTDIAVQIILTAEIGYRESALRRYEWRVQRKAELEEEERKRKLESERAEKERQRRIEQARIDRLLRDAAAFQQAGAIRKFVETIRLAQAIDTTLSSDELEQWSQWAFAQADRIDPSIGRRFLKAMEDEEAMKK